MIFFLRKFRYLKSRISTKFHRFLFIVYFFHHFWHFFFLFHLSKLVKKLWKFLQYFIRRNRDFINEFWKFLKVLLQKYRYLKYFCFQNSAVYYLFFYFFIIFDIFFLISSICTCQKILEIFMFFVILWISDFIKDFWKIMEHFPKKYRHLKSKILHKFHYLLFVFILFFQSF